MKVIEPNSVDAAIEKHVPSYERVEDEIVVNIGEISHPMEKDHYIMWIAQVSDNQTTRIRLNPGETPQVMFQYLGDAVIYAYCNVC